MGSVTDPNSSVGLLFSPLRTNRSSKIELDLSKTLRTLQIRRHRVCLADNDLSHANLNLAIVTIA
jgi:hypothetical protein